MTQTTITSYDALTPNTTIMFKTRTADYRVGIVKSVGPKTATVTNLPGKTSFTARLNRANWNRYTVRLNAVDTTPNLASTNVMVERVIRRLDAMPSGCERAALVRRDLTDARWFIRCARYVTATSVLERALNY